MYSQYAIAVYIQEQVKIKVSKSQKKIYNVLDSSKKRTLGQFYLLINAPVFFFLKNPERHNMLLRFTDLQHAHSLYVLPHEFNIDFQWCGYLYHDHQIIFIAAPNDKNHIYKIRMTFFPSSDQILSLSIGLPYFYVFEKKSFCREFWRFLYLHNQVLKRAIVSW